MLNLISKQRESSICLLSNYVLVPKCPIYCYYDVPNTKISEPVTYSILNIIDVMVLCNGGSQ